MDLLTLIEKIGYIRTRANLSARKLSMEIGKNPSYINMLETTKNFAPSFETLMDIIDVCGSTFEEFFYYDIESYKQDMHLIELLKKLDKEKKSGLIALLK